MRRIFISPCLKAGLEEASLSPTFEPAALSPAPLAGKWKERAQTIEGAPALKHGANENLEKEFSALFVLSTRTGSPKRKRGLSPRTLACASGSQTSAKRGQNSRRNVHNALVEQEQDDVSQTIGPETEGIGERIYARPFYSQLGFFP